VNRQFIF